MKVNRFKVVAIPRPCEYMRRFGATTAPANMYTGDDFAPLPQNKVDMLALADIRDAMLQREESERANKSDDNG